MKIERLFYILIMLLSKRSIVARDIAEVYDVSVRTIYRDIDTLTLAGIPIYSERGNHGGFYIADDYKLNSQLFTIQEQQLIRDISQSIVQTSGNETAQLLAEKVNALNLGKQAQPFFYDFSSWQAPETKISVIESSIETSHPVSFTYTTYNGNTSQRKIHPINLVYKSHTWYVYAYCLTRQDYRLFRISRIRNLEIHEEPFDNTNYDSISTQHIADALDKVTNDISYIDMKLTFNNKVRVRVYDLFDEGYITEEDNKLVVEKTGAMDTWLLGTILSFGNDVFIEAPLALRTKVIEISQDILSQYDRQ